MPLLLPFFSQDNWIWGVRTLKDWLRGLMRGLGLTTFGFGFHIFGGDFF